MISTLYGWSAKRSSASARETSSRTNGWSAATISRIRASIAGRSSDGSGSGSTKS